MTEVKTQKESPVKRRLRSFKKERPQYQGHQDTEVVENRRKFSQERSDTHTQRTNKIHTCRLCKRHDKVRCRIKS